MPPPPRASATLEELARTIDQLTFGVVLLRADGAIAFINETARQQIDEIGAELEGEPSGLPAVVDRCLVLRALVRRATDSSGRPGTGRGVMRAAGLDGNRYAVHVGPLPSSSSSVAMVIIVNLDVDLAPRTNFLTKLFSLTPAEASLASALASGTAPNAYGSRRGVTHNTVRTHLAQLRSKLDAKTQAGIVTKVIRAVPPLRGWLKEAS